ncbi:MAG TPA: mobile mystery protein A [Terrimicrobiaceae bacterium]|nr:mobile mystery protein A [Terrimicrobiaceae bacterium]
MNTSFPTLNLRQLDRKLTDWRQVHRQEVPSGGWIRAIRTSVGLTRLALSRILGVKSATIADLERSEAQGTITLKSLRKAAAAMDCDVVYALVPRTTLSGFLEERAQEKARAILARTSHTMALEDQAVESMDEQQFTDIVKSLLDHPKALWK